MAALTCRKLLKSRVLLPGVAVGLALALTIVWLVAPSDPLYNGKHLSTYLYDVQLPRGPVGISVPSFLSAPPPAPSSTAATLQLLQSPAPALANMQKRRAEAETAIAALGSKTIPLLGAWIQSEGSLQSRLRELSYARGSRFYWLRRWPWIATDQRAIALDVLSRIVPQHAAPLILTLRKQIIARDDAPSVETARLMQQIFSALPPEESARLARRNSDFIDNCLSNPTNRITSPASMFMSTLFRFDPPRDEEAMVRRLWPFRTQPFSNVKQLIGQLDTDGFCQNMIYLESGTSSETPSAALYFRDSPRSPERIVPLLMANLMPSSSINLLENAAAALGSYGTNATAALPLLTNLLTYRKGHIAASASNAIQGITVGKSTAEPIPN